MEQIPSLSLRASVQGSAATVVALVEKACRQFRVVSLNRQVTACKTLFAERPVIDVAVLGQFKAGKSSFINSMVGKDVLPVGVIPVTTVITRLRYGPHEKVDNRCPAVTDHRSDRYDPDDGR